MTIFFILSLGCLHRCLSFIFFRLLAVVGHDGTKTIVYISKIVIPLHTQTHTRNDEIASG